ncbi:epimerase family protein SDR39U1 [Cylas formicarius]|uniref:epimerase family protein SDR39U1 n=1 Tax=Cylas formicarius TaxID=197179 RepID=UPI0029584AA1|nr:epimerase family protein SDR39U1 [Cylas formicarius]
MAGNVLVGGGTGFVGNHLCKVLRNKGYGVNVVSRMPGPHHVSWNEINSTGLPSGTSAVVNLAGQNVMDFRRRWTPGFKQNVFSSRVNTTSALARAIENASVKPKVFVTMSGISGYRPDDDVEYSEDSPIEQFDFFSKLCLNWENAAALDPVSASKCRTVTVRSGVVLGKHGGMIKQLYLPFFLGLGGPVGDGSQYMPWIHIHDLAGLITFALESEHVRGVLNAVAPQVTTNGDFTRAFARALKRPAVIPVPAFVFNLVLGAERAKMVTAGPKVLPKRARALGYEFSYPTVEAACEAVVKEA